MSEQKVNLTDIESRLRSLTGGAGEALRAARPGVVTGGVVGGVALMALSFLFGRRRGKRRATILEVHRG